MTNGVRSSALDIEGIMGRAQRAAEAFRRLSQEETDRIVKAAFETGFKNRVRLAKLACQETRLGKWEDKVSYE